MQDTSLTIFIAIAIIGLISLGAGTVIGFILAGMRGPADNPSKARRAGLDEVARIWRDRRSGRVSIEMDGTVYNNQSELKPRQKATLTSVYHEVQLWLGIIDLSARVASPAAPVIPPKASASVAVAPTTLVNPPVEFPRTGKAAPSRSLRRPELEPKIQPPSLEIGTILARAVGPAGKDRGQQKSIAAQVDEIVQERLPNTPFQGRALRLQDSPDGGIIVIVDDKKFYGIGEVSDMTVRAYLQSCVAEWERRTAAG